ncbi:Cytochrome P450 2D9 [Apodemus speciosus]|uniref:Cytochrome P450 2D9 n=1 Tax=Apodemus speciosus TaxID=105296 RepID=A0ABQ0FK90_APOSI
MELLTGTGLWPVAIFTVIFILLVDLMHQRQCWSSRYPPRPLLWPVLGNLLQVDLDNLPYSLYKLQNRYGAVFSLQMAWKPVVVINGLKVMQEVLVTCGEDTADRPPVPIFEYWGVKSRSQGVNVGMGKKSLEESVTKEASYLCDAFTAQAGGFLREFQELIRLFVECWLHCSGSWAGHLLNSGIRRSGGTSPSH